jgi:hypothetical protein
MAWSPSWVYPENKVFLASGATITLHAFSAYAYGDSGPAAHIVCEDPPPPVALLADTSNKGQARKLLSITSSSIYDQDYINTYKSLFYYNDASGTGQISNAVQGEGSDSYYYGYYQPSP